jgi:hypothetical protein
VGFEIVGDYLLLISEKTLPVIILFLQRLSLSAKPLQFGVVFSQHPVPPNVRLWQGRRDAGVPLPGAF